MQLPSVVVTCPDWIDAVVEWDRSYATDEERMELAIRLSRENIERGTGGPFGSAVFASETGKVVGVGVNRVVALGNSVLHGETVALMMAEAVLRTYSLASPPHELFTSCEPCAMCLGATLWSGVRRLVCGATGDDARAYGFDEGPVFPESYTYLTDRDVEVVRGLMRDEARDILGRYHRLGGPVYNG
jgi:tRNA(Arg) A34 adenosine deaminase TadA